MRFILEQVENLAVSLLVITVIAGFIYLLLLIMHWRLKAKSKAREQKVLCDTWQMPAGDPLKRSEGKQSSRKN